MKIKIGWKRLFCQKFTKNVYNVDSELQRYKVTTFQQSEQMLEKQPKVIFHKFPIK